MRNLRKWGSEYVVKSHKEHGYCDSEVFEALARNLPSLALRALRETRPRGVRRWADEDAAFRLYLGGVAKAALHRSKEAQELLRRALNSKWGDEDIRGLAQARLKQMEVES